jgi:hypothetical protein
MNNANDQALMRLQQQMAAIFKYNREQRQKREKELQLRLMKAK